MATDAAAGSGAASAQGPTAARLPEPGAADVLYLVDLSGYVFRAYHALPPLSSTKGEPTHAVLGTVNMLQKVVTERKPAMLAIVMDSKGKTFRHALDVRYKATRPAPPPDLSQQMARVEQVVHAWNAACFRQDGLEADDLIAAAATRATAEGLRVVIVSADKDMMQIVHDDDDRVVLWDSMRDRVYGPLEVREKLGVPPSRVRDLLALTGDTSDNVPGVPGVGPKTATDLLTQFGSIDGIYEHLADITKPKLRENLRTHEDDARISRKLVTLDASAPIEWSREKLVWGGADVVELRRLFLELEFTRQLDQLDALARGGAGQAQATPVVAQVAPVERSYACIVDAGSLAQLVSEARSKGQLGLAVQTTSTDAMRAAIVGIALATEPARGHYVPVQHRYLGCPPQLPWEQLRTALAPLLAEGKVTVVGHDVKETSIVLARHGLPLVGPIFDTQIAAYLLDPESPNSLKELARREVGISVARHDDAAPKTRGPQATFDEL
ncbi:MAG TPA: 5'-3' exonuclease H3TH domain-containing protein, partial [Polyangiaceae bacterium]